MFVTPNCLKAVKSATVNGTIEIGNIESRLKRAGPVLVPTAESHENYLLIKLFIIVKKKIIKLRLVDQW